MLQKLIVLITKQPNAANSKMPLFSELKVA